MRRGSGASPISGTWRGIGRRALPRAARRAAAALIASALAASAAAWGSDADGSRPQTVEWLRQHAVGVSADGPSTGPDVTAIAAMRGEARVVALGEATHGTHEFLAVRNRIFEYLVEHEGFRTLAVETGFREALAIDDYLGAGSDSDPPDAVVRAMMSWSDGGTGPGRAENRELLGWLRAFNRSAGRTRVRLYGFDLSGRSAGGGFPRAAAPIHAALDYARQLEPQASDRYEERLRPLLPAFRSVSYMDKPYDHLSAAQRDTLTAVLADLAAWFERRKAPWTQGTSAEAYGLAAHAVAEARELDGFFQVNFGRRGLSGPAEIFRDSIMAVNLGWVLEQREDSGPVFVFAHDMHVEKGSGQPRMGSFLAARGTRALTIGTVDALRPGGGASPAGAPQGPDGVGAVCADVGPPAFVVDLRQVPRSGPVHDWLAQPRLVNPVALASSQPYAIHALDWFDALIFVRTLTYGR